MSEWNPLLGYNIELINDLGSDYHEGMSLMIDTKDTDRSPGTSIESVLKLPPINSILYLETILEIILFTSSCQSAHEIMDHEYVSAQPEKYTGVEPYSFIITPWLFPCYWLDK